MFYLFEWWLEADGGRSNPLYSSAVNDRYRCVDRYPKSQFFLFTLFFRALSSGFIQ